MSRITRYPPTVRGGDYRRDGDWKAQHSMCIVPMRLASSLSSGSTLADMYSPAHTDDEPGCCEGYTARPVSRIEHLLM